jgi:hypothetical protein
LATNVNVDASGAVYVGGYFYGLSQSFLGDTISVTGGSSDQDGFIFKLTNNGQLEWAKDVGSGNLDEVVVCKFDSQNNMYLYATTFGSGFDADFGPGTQTYATQGSGDCVLMKYEPACNVNVGVVVTNYTITSFANGATYQWLNCDSNTAIPGATSISYTATANGNYAVIVTQDACVDTSTCTNITGMGIQNYSSNNAIQIIPNPSIGNFTITSDNKMKQVTINDMLGNQVQIFKVASGTNHINIQNLSKGLYVVNVLYNNGTSNKSKIVVE